MVAYTPDLCIPFFEPADNPCTMLGTVCEPVSVWCSAIAIVEDHLTAIDAVVARTATAIPMAMVSYSPVTPVTLLRPVPFDITNIDTDNMVDLSVLQGITVNRNGVYGINGQILIDNLAVDDFPDIRIYIGNETAPGLTGALFSGPLRGTTRGFGVDQWVHVQGSYQFTDLSPSPRTVTMVVNSPTNPIVEAHLSVFWHSDLDS